MYRFKFEDILICFCFLLFSETIWLCFLRFKKSEKNSSIFVTFRKIRLYNHMIRNVLYFFYMSEFAARKSTMWKKIIWFNMIRIGLWKINNFFLTVFAQ